jgi:hypothetical protein
VEELKEMDQMMALQRLENASALVRRDGEIESLKKRHQGTEEQNRFDFASQYGRQITIPN